MSNNKSVSREIYSPGNIIAFKSSHNYTQVFLLVEGHETAYHFPDGSFILKSIALDKSRNYSIPVDSYFNLITTPLFVIEAKNNNK